jgi:hypothetical protein
VIEEEWYIVADGSVTLTAAVPLPGEGYRRELKVRNDELAVAKQLLRNKVSRPRRGNIWGPPKLMYVRGSCDSSGGKPNGGSHVNDDAGGV